MQGKTVTNLPTPQWPHDIENDIKRGMDRAEREVIKTIELLGMVPTLVKGNILRLQDEDIICMNAPELETFAVWHQDDKPDENDIISSDELLNLDNGVLLDSIRESNELVRAAAIDVAVTASLSEDEVIDDEDSPTHCALYQDKMCKYQDSAFKPPRKTLWVGCSFPSCGQRYHEQCLSLHFTSQQTRNKYNIICKKHTDVREHFQDRVTATTNDLHSLDGEDVSLGIRPKRFRRLQGPETSTEHRTDYSVHPSYVEYEGNYFHIAEFLSLQQGKVYRPTMSRLSRWIESARNDFYERIEKSVNPSRVSLGVYLYDIVAVWLPSKGLRLGYVIRFIRSPTLKSHFPIFEWRSDLKKEKVATSIRLLKFDRKEENNWELSVCNHYEWCETIAIIKVIGKVDEKTEWPLIVDLSEIMEKVPALTEMDREREKKEAMLKKEEREQRKKGRAEDMTVQLLKEVLREMGVHFTQSCRKAELINKLTEARKQANQTTDADSIREYCEATINSNNNRATEAVVDDGGRSYSTNRPGNEHTTENISGFVFRYPVYYFDAKKDRLWYLLLHLVFLLEIIGIYLGQATYLQAIFLLLLVQVYISLACLAYVILCLHITELLLLYFTSNLYASVNLAPFLNNVVFAA